MYQNLAVVPLMPVWRNFFLGQELRKKSFPFSLDANAMRATTLTELSKMGIELPDVDAPIGSLSGGQRQCVAIARAVFFGARVLILDEPTAALGVKQSGVVLKYITAAKEAGFGVVFITHNPHHAHMVGDHFVLLNRGRQKLDCTYDDITLEHLTQEMAGGDELEALTHELGRQVAEHHPPSGPVDRLVGGAFGIKPPCMISTVSTVDAGPQAVGRRILVSAPAAELFALVA